MVIRDMSMIIRRPRRAPAALPMANTPNRGWRAHGSCYAGRNPSLLVANGSNGARPSPISDSLFRQDEGAMLICCMVMLVLYGVSVLQMYLYYINYPKDHRLIKITVVALFWMSMVQAVFCCHTVYYYIILTYHDPLLLIGGDWSLFIVSGVGVVTCSLVQLFYTRMIYHLAKNKWGKFVTIALVLLILMHIAFGIVTSVREFGKWKISNISNIAFNSVVPILATRVAADIVTVLSLCLLLHGAQLQYAGSSKLFQTLMIYAVNRFFLSTIFSLVQIIVLICFPAHIWAMTIEFFTVHLYVNSCLAMLNSRNHLQNIGDPSVESSNILTTGHIIQFESSDSHVTGRDRSSVNSESHSVRALDGVDIEMANSVKAHKPDSSL